jgi:3-hydroxybutyryl-CoA dehydrogenase
MPQDIASVAVVGYGVMGAGIVRSFAAAGFRVAVVSRRATELRDLPAGVGASPDLPAEAPDLVVETVEEDARAKAAVYRAVEAAYPPSTLLATNTSGLPLESLAAGLAHPERFLGVHWFHPADVFPMVEVVAGPVTPPAAVDRVAAALARTGKEPIVLYRPVVGYVINRLQHCILHEAYHMIAAGIASAETIDRVARSMLGPRMCVTGLVEQKDLAGLTPHALAQRSIVPTLDHTGIPNAMLQAMVAGGDTGLDAGRGFYDWTGLDAGTVRADAASRLRALLDSLAALGSGPAPRCRPREELPWRGDDSGTIPTAGSPAR